ncbi:hypothetical protein COH20_000072 [Aspergillus flavus]|uniref:Uncharacterized protein n=1 Tax=Aspergillus oryzae TaxID=5062 RepID=A0A1S9DNC0_ASPOZ|nr:hypothetical protein NYO67_408 [Aspergillus flavus]KOC09463.1 hypothetical protein AFLA70_45g003811 [Aspergillus flavus AF70]OOO10444.1 hypothetical protein OAory_01062520 [Aspergillus oryzae]RAQ63648.1 hypothetical protein COH20_000072 [Aspergillus flavus]RAQ80656.1 hypothetical protein COH21_009443 [Aspergillus flavus]
MCGIARPSTGHRIAVMFPSANTKSMTPYSLFFREMPDAGTKAVFRIEDASTFDVFRGCRGIDLRIERYGDLTSARMSEPLHQFRLQPGGKGNDEMEFELPERLDLGVSETGIVGRQVTVLVEGQSSVGVGMGIVGYD